MKRLLILLLLLSFDAHASELVEIRTGSHLNFSRVVLQFDEMTQFQISRDIEHETILVDCEVDQADDLRNVPIYPLDEFLSGVEPVFSGRILSVAIHLKSANAALSHYTMTRPFRLVLDVSRGGPTVSRQNRDQSFVAPTQSVESVPIDPREVSVATAVKTFVAPTPDVQEELRDEDTLTPEPVADDSSSDSTTMSSPIDLQISELLRVQELHHPNRIKAQRPLAVAGAGKEGWTRGQYGLAILAGFLVLDILLLVYFKINRRSKKSITKPARVRAERKHLLRRKKKQNKPAVPEPVNDVKASRPNPDFVNALTKVMKSPEPEKARFPITGVVEATPGGDDSKRPSAQIMESARLPEVQNEMDKFNAVIRIDSMIASVSDAVGKPADKFAYVPELTDILHDMQSKMSPDARPEQLTKEVLIGQDGLEFMKNLRRLFLN